MGLVQSALGAQAESAPAPPRPGQITAGQPSFLPPTAAAIAIRQEAAVKPRVNYQQLPPPVRYEELQREVMMSLKPDLFEGLKFDFNKPLNMNFALSHSSLIMCSRGLVQHVLAPNIPNPLLVITKTANAACSLLLTNVELPQELLQQQLPSVGPPKAAIGRYEFGANLISNTGDMMIGRITHDGTLSGRIKYDLTDWMSLKAQLSISPEEGGSQNMFDVDLKGKDWNGQVKFGNGGFYGLNYLQSITPQLAAGGEIFWLSQQRKSGVGFSVRQAADKHVATAQVATTGLVSLGYLQKINEKVSLAADFMWNWRLREPSASFGYDYMLRQCRLRGRIDTHGKIGAYLEERVNMGVNLLLSAELDHSRKDYKFGFGLSIGE